ncbi:MAG: thiamine-phosphate kinase, partial [Planctomycetota bacterium]
MIEDELAFVEWIRRHAPPHEALRTGPGDDMAVVVLDGGKTVLVASDQLLAGVHFDPQRDPPDLVGRKAVGCCLSDCAAMAVRPMAMTLSIAWPTDRPFEEACRILEGAWTLASTFDVPLAGGDTTRWKHPAAVDIAVVAAPYAGIEPVRRSGAKPGDGLFVTGRLGGSRLGKHLRFTPRVVEARELAAALGSRLHAMIDLSDGLSLDLWRVCKASGVGARLFESALAEVVSDDARTCARTSGKTVLEHVLGDGEDFELLFAADGEVSAAGIQAYRIGEIVEGEGMTLVAPDGRET